MGPNRTALNWVVPSRVGTILVLPMSASLIRSCSASVGALKAPVWMKICAGRSTGRAFTAAGVSGNGAVPVLAVTPDPGGGDTGGGVLAAGATVLTILTDTAVAGAAFRVRGTNGA